MQKKSHRISQMNESVPGMTAIHKCAMNLRDFMKNNPIESNVEDKNGCPSARAIQA